MSDKNERTENDEAREKRSYADMPDCCGPMFERMMKAFRGPSEDSEGGSPTDPSESSEASPCASVMRRMASACGGRATQAETADE